MTNAEVTEVYSWNNRKLSKDVIKKSLINGRTVYKQGNLQNVTFIGQLYKLYSPDSDGNKYIMLVGFSKQHPNEICEDQETGNEIAMINAWTKPVITFKFRKKPSERFFIRTVTGYYMTNIHDKLDFIKTREEMN